jgi:hypothetical protein
MDHITKISNSQTRSLIQQNRQLGNITPLSHLHQSLHGKKYSRKTEGQYSDISYIPRNLLPLSKKH